MNKVVKNLVISVASLALLTSCSNMSEVDYETFHEKATAVEEITYSAFSSEGSYTTTTDGVSETSDLTASFELNEEGSSYTATEGTTEAQLVVAIYVGLLTAGNVSETDGYSYYVGDSGFKVSGSDILTEETDSEGNLVSTTESLTLEFNSYGYLTFLDLESTAVTTSGDTSSTTISTMELTITYVK